MFELCVPALQQQYQSALFWADKTASLSHGESYCVVGLKPQ